MQEGFTLTTTPDLARNEILEGIGFNPRGPETQIYSIENSDLSLVGTAEITLGGMYLRPDARRRAAADQDLRHQPLLPHRGGGARRRRPAASTACTSSRRSRCSPTRCPRPATRCTTQLLAIECKIFDGLGIPYRVIDTASGDLGGPAYRKFDLEAWMPGRGDGRRVRRSHQHQQLHRLPVPPPRHPLQEEGRKRDALRPHAQRHRRRHQPGADRHPGKLPAGRRQRDRARGAADLGRQRTFRKHFEQLSFVLELQL